MEFTESDLEQMRECLRDMLADGMDWPDGPETICTSQGYVDVWICGTVTAYGRKVAEVDACSVA